MTSISKLLESRKKALLKKKHQLTGAEDQKQLTLKKKAENEGHHQPQTVDWSAWDAC